MSRRRTRKQNPRIPPLGAAATAGRPSPRNSSLTRKAEGNTNRRYSVFELLAEESRNCRRRCAWPDRARAPSAKRQTVHVFRFSSRVES